MHVPPTISHLWGGGIENAGGTDFEARIAFEVQTQLVLAEPSDISNSDFLLFVF